MNPSILIVIPTLNEAGTIVPVLESLGTGLPEQAAVRFVVADGGSRDGTPEIVRRLAAGRDDLVLLPNPRRLQSAAVNLAVAEFGVGTDVLVRCDAHAVYPPGFIARLLATLERTGADAVVVPMDSEGENCVQRAVAWVSDTPLGSGGSAHRGGRQSGFVDHGHHAAFRLSSFRRAGGYDETFSHNEDAELDCRQRAHGGRIYLDAETRLTYRPRATLSSLARQYFAYGKGRSRTVRRHPGSLRARQLAVPMHLAVCLLALLLSPWAPWLLAWPGLYVLALAGASVGLAVRHRSPCGLLAGPAAFVMHAAWAAGFAWGCLTVREARWRLPGLTGPARGSTA